jgi:hypothetical protein
VYDDVGVVPVNVAVCFLPYRYVDGTYVSTVSTYGADESANLLLIVQDFEKKKAQLFKNKVKHD